MTRPIHTDILAEIRLLYGQKCLITGSSHVVLHHHHQFARRQLDESWAIVPVSPKIHDILHGKGEYDPEYRKELWQRLDWITLSHASDSDLIKYSKVRDLVKYRDTLKQIYGKE